VSEKEALQERIDQCRRILSVELDQTTVVRLREWLAELEDQLARLKP
jgi:hypothetical protein